MIQLRILNNLEKDPQKSPAQYINLIKSQKISFRIFVDLQKNTTLVQVIASFWILQCLRFSQRISFLRILSDLSDYFCIPGYFYSPYKPLNCERLLGLFENHEAIEVFQDSRVDYQQTYVAPSEVGMRLRIFQIIDYSLQIKSIIHEVPLHIFLIYFFGFLEIPMRTKIKILRNRAIIRDVFAARFVMSDDYKYSLNG